MFESISFLFDFFLSFYIHIHPFYSPAVIDRF